MDKQQILVVEDDMDLAEMLETYFRASDFQVHKAATGEEALKQADEQTLDLILLDVRLPDIDGFEVCRRLRGQHRTQNTPIIFLTEKRERVDKLHGLQLGVVDYITKPFDIQELKLRIRNAINRAQRPVISNPITDLPEGVIIDDKLELLVKGSDSWALLLFSVGNLERFREMYGFVAADDVLRSVALMIRNAVKEFGSSSDYIAHRGLADFIIFTQVEHVGKIHERITTRVSKSREYFYPLKDREKAREAIEADQLQLRSAVVRHSDGPFATVDALKKSLRDVLTADTKKVEPGSHGG